MTRRLAIANRGEIAVRIAATCRRLGIEPVLLAAEPDADGYAARQIGHIALLGPAGAEMDPERVVGAAVAAGATDLHPGYGFLSERPALPRACAKAGIRFIGPTARTLEICGDKVATRRIAAKAGVPLLPASDILGDHPDEWRQVAGEIGYPLLVKAVAGGGGASLRRVNGEADLIDAVASSRGEAEAAGAGAALYLERFLDDARHIEVQLVGDGQRCLALGERDCSLQRRHQKVIEEAPAAHLPDAVRQRLFEYAVAIGRAVDLVSLATVEFLYGSDSTIAFIEVNPRLQVEHPVTEAVTGLDLVALQIDIADGQALPDVTPPARGHAIEARLYAEDPANHFLPSPGLLDVFTMPTLPGLRIDAGYARVDRVPDRYDPLLAKLIAYGSTRDEAIGRLRDALRQAAVAGVTTNRSWLLQLLRTPDVVGGHYSTQTAGAVAPQIPASPPPVVTAALATTMLDRPPSDDPWESLGPFRLDGAATLAFHGVDGRWEAVATVDRNDRGWRLCQGEDCRILRWWSGVDGLWTVRFGDDTVRCAVARRPDGSIDVATDEGRWIARPGRRPSEGAGHDRRAESAVRAPLPGKVLRVVAESGEPVEEGQPLVILSAMKIEIVLRASHRARVRAVHCHPDQQVDAGDLLVELSTEEDG